MFLEYSICWRIYFRQPHGDPKKGINAIQIEIRKDLYFDEKDLKLSKNFKKIRISMQKLIKNLNYMLHDLDHFKRSAEQKNFIIMSKTLEEKIDIQGNLVNDGKYNDALILSQELYKEYPNEIRVLNNMALAYKKLGKNNDARAVFLKIIDLDHDPSGQQFTSECWVFVIEPRCS